MSKPHPWLALSCLLLLGTDPNHAATGFQLPTESSQVILGLADNWNSSQVTLSLWEKSNGSWEQSGSSWTGRLGKSGLAWGKGLQPSGLPGPSKVESDGRAPAGIFRIGEAYGYAPNTPHNRNLPYNQITPSDLWVEDISSPDYNRHLRLPGGRTPQTEWEKQQQMRQNDPAHSLKLFIACNAWPDAEPGKGSAIFFHIWRQNGGLPSAGCTTIPEDQLRGLIQWVDPSRQPLYVLLPQAEYTHFRKSWNLP